MKRRIVICIIIVFLFLFAVEMVERRNYSTKQEEEMSYDKQPEETEAAIESSFYEEPYQFVVVNEQGRLTVYLSDKKTVYMDTGIQNETMPQPLKEQLTDGIYFNSEDELYEFLENYSS